MYVYGSFFNQQRELITVHILTNADRSVEVEIGDEEQGLFFTDNPIEINSEVNDTFDHLLRYSASIRLFSNKFISDFFCASPQDAVVNIYSGQTCLFAGFIEPQTYSQPFNELFDQVELNCIDALSALQYSKYKNIGNLGVTYNQIKGNATQCSFYEIITKTLNEVTNDLDIVGKEKIRYLFDGSKAIDDEKENHYMLLKQLSISELLFLGDKENEVWEQDKVLEELLRYLNLHIVQDGFTFYIFSWETVKSNNAISWRNLVNGQVATTSRKVITINNDNVVGCETTINIGEVFNQILLTCRVEEINTIIESPLDNNLLVSPFVNKQKYCTEYSSDGEGIAAYRAFNAMCHDRGTNYGAGSIVDWYLRIMANPQWIFPINGNIKEDLIAKFSKGGKKQQDLANWLGKNPGAAIIAIGDVETNTAKDDNNPISKVNMTNYLVISINGNGKDGENEFYPDAADIKANIPYAVYTGNSVGGNFSPVDDETTNYIVLSGNIVLNPLMEMTDTFKVLNNTHSENWNKWWYKTVPSRTNKDGRYYTRRYWKAENPKETVVWDEEIDYGLIPFSGKRPEQYEFKYSAIGDGTDTISKIAVLSCMLIIGDKCVIEKTPSNDLGTGKAYTGHGEPEDFVWKKYKTLSECNNEDEYYQQSFTIGFNPKIGDKLVGADFDLQNNISYTMGIEAQGTAIPIHKSDRISGQVKFMILGPVNTVWDEITRRHPTFFRHTKWSSRTVPLLAHVSNIMIKSFEIKVYSDYGLVNSTEDNDLIYMSDTCEEFVNKKDDLEFKINSALTSVECQELGIINSINTSTPLNVSTEESVLNIYDYSRALQAKPEQLYVDSYYTEYHLPRVLMEQKLLDSNTSIGLFNHYIHPALNKVFFVQGISRNLLEGYANLMLKEIDR